MDTLQEISDLVCYTGSIGGSLAYMEDSEIEARLVKLAKSSRTAKAVFTYLAERDRDSDGWDIRRRRKDLEDSGVKVNAKAYFEVFSEMQKLGLGHMEYGTRGGAQYWSWAVLQGQLVSGKAVGRIALNKAQIKDTGLTARAKFASPIMTAQDSGAQINASIPCLLKSGKVILVSVPQNLSIEDYRELVLRLQKAS